MLPAASWTVAVSTRVAPEVRLVTAPVSAIWAAAPCVIVIEGDAPRLAHVPLAAERCCACQVCAPAGAGGGRARAAARLRAVDDRERRARGEREPGNGDRLAGHSDRARATRSCSRRSRPSATARSSRWDDERDRAVAHAAGRDGVRERDRVAGRLRDDARGRRRQRPRAVGGERGDCDRLADVDRPRDVRSPSACRSCRWRRPPRRRDRSTSGWPRRCSSRGVPALVREACPVRGRRPLPVAAPTSVSSRGSPPSS